MSCLWLGLLSSFLPPPDTLWLLCDLAVLEFFFDQVPQAVVLETQIRVHPLELGVLGLEFFHPLQVRGVHAPIFGFPARKGGWTDPVLTADVLDLNPGISFVQDRYNLSLGESGLLHQNLLA